MVDVVGYIVVDCYCICIVRNIIVGVIVVIYFYFVLYFLFYILFFVIFYMIDDSLNYINVYFMYFFV